jgi:hypothetical protein
MVIETLLEKLLDLEIKLGILNLLLKIISFEKTLLLARYCSNPLPVVIHLIFITTLGGRYC